MVCAWNWLEGWQRNVYMRDLKASPKNPVNHTGNS